MRDVAGHRMWLDRASTGSGHDVAKYVAGRRMWLDRASTGSGRDVAKYGPGAGCGAIGRAQGTGVMWLGVGCGRAIGRAQDVGVQRGRA